MTVTLDIPPEAEQRLRAEAARTGQEVGVYLGQVVQEKLFVPLMTEEGRRAWKDLFDDLEAGDPEEQRETLAMLEKVLDEDRPGQRRVFGSGYNPAAQEDK